MDICVKDICAVGYFGNPILCALKPQKPGPPPTCPFIYYHNVKEPNRFDPITTDEKPDTQGSPINLPEE
jgi:hypothetical protein